MNKDYFAYNAGSTIPKDAFRISPSQLSKFFDSTSAWYREHLMGEEGFTGSTASNLGNCVHAAAEMYSLTDEVDFDAINSFIDGLGSEIDKDYIRVQYPGMVQTLVNEYLSSAPKGEAEVFLSYEILPGIFVGGTLDRIEGCAIEDYKTTSSNKAPTKFRRDYWFQQMTYAFIANKLGYKITEIRLVFITTNDCDRYSEKTGKRLKDYPSTLSIVTHQITKADMELIENTLKLVAESVQTWKRSPELRHLIAQDYRLKTLPKRKLFK